MGHQSQGRVRDLVTVRALCLSPVCLCLASFFLAASGLLHVGGSVTERSPRAQPSRSATQEAKESGPVVSLARSFNYTVARQLDLLPEETLEGGEEGLRVRIMSQGATFVTVTYVLSVKQYVWHFVTPLCGY